MDTQVIKFIKPAGGYEPGQVRKFRSDQAASLVDQNLAVAFRTSENNAEALDLENDFTIPETEMEKGGTVNERDSD